MKNHTLSIVYGAIIVITLSLMTVPFILILLRSYWR